MPSWLILSLIIVVSFVAALLLSERLSARISRRRKVSDLPQMTPLTKQDGWPSGW